ncbi:uncharacterized protein J3R85_011044 [Psidium guajava]|nr:uncharacterized protein J3R85_011044 [Psidium guajava]
MVTRTIEKGKRYRVGGFTCPSDIKLPLQPSHEVRRAAAEVSPSHGRFRPTAMFRTGFNYCTSLLMLLALLALWLPFPNRS